MSPIVLAVCLLLPLVVVACATGAARRSVGDGATPAESPSPPVAVQRPVIHREHGDERVDEYAWLRDRADPEVIGYLEAENAYTRAAMAGTEELQEELYREIVGRIQETDLSVPWRHGPYWYYVRTEQGRSYPIHCRKRGDLEAAEEVLLDENVLAEGQDYLRVGALEPSPGHGLLAYSVDMDGSERFALRFRDLTTGTDLPDRIPGVSTSIAWGNDDATVLYVKLDDAHRPFEVWRHRLGTPAEADQLVHRETDERFFVDVSRTRSGRFLLIDIGSKVTSEVRYLDADRPDGQFAVLAPREQGVEYDVVHHDERFFVRTNLQALNFRLMEAPVASPGREHWREVLAHRPDAMITRLDAFRDHLVIWERSEGLPRARVRELASSAEHVIEMPEPAYSLRPGRNDEFDTTTLRFHYTSLVTPESVFDYDLARRTRELRKEQPVLGGYDRERWVTERLWASAPDGARVPISVVRRRGAPLDGASPFLLIGYGSYGMSYDPTFASSRLSLLERGVGIGIAHVRGGGELGRAWYENGKFLHKRNTFGDFIACAEHLIEAGYTSADRLAISGGSAGGLLMGAVVNERPELFRAVVAHVPFVDVVTTMLDESIPLTVTEFEEWGNPKERAYYDYMKSYSPYDNVGPREYPDMLITAGLYDPRVQYWEPAKWVARLRARKTGEHVLLLKTNMDAGHGGKSGRYERFRELAFDYAFLLDRLGLVERSGGAS